MTNSDQKHTRKILRIYNMPAGVLVRQQQQQQQQQQGGQQGQQQQQGQQGAEAAAEASTDIAVRFLSFLGDGWRCDATLIVNVRWILHADHLRRKWTDQPVTVWVNARVTTRVTARVTALWPPEWPPDWPPDQIKILWRLRVYSSWWDLWLASSISTAYYYRKTKKITVKADRASSSVGPAHVVKAVWASSSAGPAHVVQAAWASSSAGPAHVVQAAWTSSSAGPALVVQAVWAFRLSDQPMLCRPGLSFFVRRTSPCCAGGLSFFVRRTSPCCAGGLSFFGPPDQPMLCRRSVLFRLSTCPCCTGRHWLRPQYCKRTTRAWQMAIISIDFSTFFFRPDIIYSEIWCLTRSIIFQIDRLEPYVVPRTVLCHELSNQFTDTHSIRYLSRTRSARLSTSADETRRLRTSSRCCILWFLPQDTTCVLSPRKCTTSIFPGHDLFVRAHEVFPCPVQLSRAVCHSLLKRLRHLTLGRSRKSWKQFCLPEFYTLAFMKYTLHYISSLKWIHQHTRYCHVDVILL